MSLKAMASPAAREPGPLVTLVLSLTVAKVDSIGFEVFKCTQCSAGKSKKHSSGPRSSRSFSAAFGHFAWNSLSNALAASRACSRSSASLTSVSIFFASGWMDLGRASRMFADLCTQQVQNIRRSLLPGDEADRLRSKCARAVELLDSYAAVHPANSQLRRFPSSTT